MAYFHTVLAPLLLICSSSLFIFNRTCLLIVELSAITYMPLSILRYLPDVGLPDSVVKTNRYGDFANDLFDRVDRPDLGFRGIWAVKGGFDSGSGKHNSDPARSDVVIYFLHGGGYSSSTPASYFLFLLKLAETISRVGRKKVSVFGLDYDLAPEARFPKQLTQARAAYEWLLRAKEDDGVGVSARKILLAGDSAGGHLCLSLLVDLWKPLRDKGNEQTRQDGRPSVMGSGIPKPGIGLVLLSPWLSLYHVSDSFSRNAMTDILTKDFLFRCADNFLGPENKRIVPDEYLPWVEFLDNKTGTIWDEVLPAWIWVSSGRNEMFYDDNVKWLHDREADCPAKSKTEKRLDGEVDRDEVHDYAWVEMTDPTSKDKYLYANVHGEDSSAGFDATERIGLAIVGRLNAMSVARP